MKTLISKVNLPATSRLHEYLEKIDFEDAYAFRGQSQGMSMEDVYIKIFNTTPLWVEYAMRLRNVLVAPFGLKTEIDKNRLPSVKEGEKSGIFRIYRILENEIIAGEDDQHLNFRVSVHRKTAESSVITVSTIVQYNNAFGRFYMTLLSPFHKMVVKSILSSSVKIICAGSAHLEKIPSHLMNVPED